MTTPTRSQRSPLLVGIIAGVLLFVFMGLSLAIGLIPVLGQSENILPNPETVWSPPVPTAVVDAGAFLPTAVPNAETATATPALPTPSGPQTFRIGDQAVNVNDGPVNLRSSPGFRDKPASDRLALVPVGAMLAIVGGPQEVDGLIWWQVRWQDMDGWMAERRASGPRILALPESQ